MQTNSLTRLGYDTRSWRSALVMQGVDLLRPLRSDRPFRWEGPCVISSIAGLGDLFIHLPLIEGLRQACAERGIAVRVALQPAHVPIGEACGWDVLPFDDGLVDLFKMPEQLAPARLLQQVRKMRKDPARLWIDLTGNAVSAVAIKLTGAKFLAARVTRGGRSLIDHALPHSVQENEYGNRQRIAEHLGCAVEPAIFDRLHQSLPAIRNLVVLSLTTACHWKNWPLRNFLFLIDRFPHVTFALTGLRREIEADEHETLEQIRSRPNVVDYVDRLSILELVQLIAHSTAVVTNDTGAAHIANGFRKEGAVLFGPVSPGTFASPEGLRIFHDSTCPLHPCVQWRCDRPADWCMKKIAGADVADYLATLPAFR